MTPKTEIVHADLDFRHVFDPDHSGSAKDFTQFVKLLCRAANKIGYPAFLRTGQGSGKHYWDKTCFVLHPDTMAGHVAELVEWSECVDMIGLPYDVWAVREMLRPLVAFKAFSGNMPISRERRYFVQDGSVLGHIPYWPEDAIGEWMDHLAEHNAAVKQMEKMDLGSKRGFIEPVENWQIKLKKLNEETAEEIPILTDLSYEVAQHFEGAWSVDWLYDVRGEWYCTDMALAHCSWGWDQIPDKLRGDRNEHHNELQEGGASEQAD